MPDHRNTLSRTPIVPTPPAGAERRADNGVSLTVLPPAARWSLRIDPADAATLASVAGFEVGQPINSSAGKDKLSLRLGPNEWLLIADPPHAGLAGDLQTALAGRHHSLVDISDRHVAFFLAGEKAADLLAAGCPLDLGDRAFPPGMATRTLFAKAEIILMHMPDAGGYRIECWRSFARYMQAYLRDAAMLNAMPIS